jgi:hypothetical protein
MARAAVRCWTSVLAKYARSMCNSRRVHFCAARVERILQKRAYSREQLLREVRDLVMARGQPAPPST